MVSIILFFVGIILILSGAEALVSGATGIAKRFHLSEFLIGVTIVGIGTSVPELTVSVFAALKGNADISVANISGSNLFNTWLILGLTALVSPIKFYPDNIRRDIPTCIIVSILLLGMVLLNGYLFKDALETPLFSLNRIDGAILLALMIIYLWVSFKNGEDQNQHFSEENVYEERNILVYVGMILAGLAALIFGGNLFVDAGTEIAKAIGISDTIIGLTLMAGGTSLPELATCLVAARKGMNQLALGNVIGSNVSNILLILGCSSMITPLHVNNENLLSLSMMLISAITLVFIPITVKKKELNRPWGISFTLLYVLYIAYMCLKSLGKIPF